MLESNVLAAGAGIYIWSWNACFSAWRWGCPSTGTMWASESPLGHNEHGGLLCSGSSGHITQTSCCSAPKRKSHPTDCCRAAMCINSIYQIINFGHREQNDHNLQSSSGNVGKEWCCSVVGCKWAQWVCCIVSVDVLNTLGSLKVILMETRESSSLPSECLSAIFLGFDLI